MKKNTSIYGTLMWGSLGIVMIAWGINKLSFWDEVTNQDVTMKDYIVKRVPWIQEALGSALSLAVSEPRPGMDCESMERYFNNKFGRSTKFANFYGNTVSVLDESISCGDGVAIETFPTGKKTCPASITYSLRSKEMSWHSDRMNQCFVTQ